MKIIYIAGPYRGEPYQVDIHAHAARMAALSVIRDGNYPFTPHLNTLHMDGAAPDEFFLDGGIRMLSMCDEMLLLPCWENSSGTLKEIEYARSHGIPIRQYVPSDDLI
jgi:hypothetical protein